MSSENEKPASASNVMPVDSNDVGQQKRKLSAVVGNKALSNAKVTAASIKKKLKSCKETCGDWQPISHENEETLKTLAPVIAAMNESEPFLEMTVSCPMKPHANPPKLYKKGGELIYDFESTRLRYKSKSAKPPPAFDPQDLIKLAKPAPFGRGADTVHDETVRKALQLSRNEVEKPYLGMVANEIRKLLRRMAPVGYYLRPSFYKIHVYRPGDFFKPHRDTLHATNHFGTLLVSVPTEHTGGGLRVTVGNKTWTWKTGSDDPANNVERSQFNWKVCAFFTDCVHEVLPVTSGCRVVLQYDIFVFSHDEQVDSSPMRVDPSDTKEPSAIAAAAKPKDPWKNYSRTDHWWINDDDMDINVGKNELGDVVRRFVHTVDALPVERSLKHDSDAILKAVEKVVLPQTADAKPKPLVIVLQHSYSAQAVAGDLFRGVDRVLIDALAKSKSLELQAVPICVVRNFECGGVQSYDVLPFHEGKGNAPEIFKGPASVLFPSASSESLYISSSLHDTGNEGSEGFQKYSMFALWVGPKGWSAAGAPPATCSIPSDEEVEKVPKGRKRKGGGGKRGRDPWAWLLGGGGMGDDDDDDDDVFGYGRDSDEDEGGWW